MKPSHKKELHNLLSDLEESDLEEAERIVKVHRDSHRKEPKKNGFGF